MSDERSRGSRGDALGAGDPLERLGRWDPLERLGRLSWRRPARVARQGGIVVGSFAGILVVLGVTVALVGGIAAAVTTLTKPAAPPALVPHGHVTEAMSIVSGTSGATNGWPEYTHASWTVHKGETVTVKITSFDDGTAPLVGSQMMFAHVMGSTNGHETVDGRSITSVPDVNIAHTFTVPALNFNMPIPVAPTNGHVTVVATFVAAKTGTFTWQCYAPCGSGTNSMGGAMATMGWMEGTIKVTA